MCSRVPRTHALNVLQLIDLVLSLPASSADCERGFSLAKVIKSDWRSRLKGHRSDKSHGNTAPQS